MNLKSAITEQIAYGKYLYYTKGNKASDVDIANIPDEWDRFNDTKDKWVKISYPIEAEVSGCLYKVKELVFSNHVHFKSDEIIRNITPNTSFTVYTPKWYKTVNYGESVLIPRGVKHICIWHKIEMIVDIVWHPPMKGWQGEFLKEKT